jgi:peptidoglycan/xylan/chitin deacetylase (PgdA/CDA1 family)
LPEKSIVITFDDGIISTREYAYPILKKHGFVAEQFIITGRIQVSPPKFDWTGLQFLSQKDMDNMTDVFNYGSHTHALHNFIEGVSDLTSKSDSVVYSDLQKSKQILGTNHFAYPFGKYDSATLHTLKSLGFTMAVTTENGKINLGEDKLQLQRINIVPGMTLTNFAKAVNN